tara:strand:- start:79 stop:360 length:282 start_codon:yes stop_codon:yes gene_type:complete
MNSNIKKIRSKLDKLDNELLKILKQRTKLVDLILKNKRFKNQIVDKRRIKVILNKIKKKSLKKKIDTIVTKKIWIAMIKAYIDYEFRNFSKRK